MKKFSFILMAALFSGAAFAQTSTSTGLPLYSSGYMALPYGSAPGLADAPSVLGAGVNEGVFSMLSVEEGTMLSLSSLPQLGGSSGPQSFVTRMNAQHVLNENTSIVGGLAYFQSGNVELRDSEGNELGTFTPSETNLQVGVVQRFAENFKGGVKLGYASTNLGSSAQSTSITETALNLGFSLDYIAEVADGELAAYWALNYIGKKNTFSASNLNYLPTQMQLGAVWSKEVSDAFKIAPGLNLQKFLVPTSPLLNADGSILAGKPQPTGLFASMFGSFNDAPGGMSEEVQEWRVLISVEALVKDKFFLGAAASLENSEKGNRQFVSFGAGLSTTSLRVGAGYMIPLSQGAAYYTGATGITVSVLF